MLFIGYRRNQLAINNAVTDPSLQQQDLHQVFQVLLMQRASLAERMPIYSDLFLLHTAGLIYCLCQYKSSVFHYIDYI